MENYRKNKVEELIEIGDNEWNNLLVEINNNDFFKYYEYLDDKEKNKRLNQYSYRLGLIMEYYLKALYLENFNFPEEYIEIINEKLSKSREAKNIGITRITEEDIVDIIENNITPRTRIIKKIMNQNSDDKTYTFNEKKDMTFMDISHKFAMLIDSEKIGNKNYNEILIKLIELNYEKIKQHLEDKKDDSIEKIEQNPKIREELSSEKIIQLTIKSNVPKLLYDDKQNLTLVRQEKDLVSWPYSRKINTSSENSLRTDISSIEEIILEILNKKEINNVFKESRYNAITKSNPNFSFLMELCKITSDVIGMNKQRICFRLEDNHLEETINLNNEQSKIKLNFYGISRKSIDINDKIIIIRDKDIDLIQNRGLSPVEKNLSNEFYEENYNMSVGLVKIGNYGIKEINPNIKIEKDNGIIIMSNNEFKYYICTNGGLMEVQESLFNRKYNYPLESDKYKELKEQLQNENKLNKAK